MSGRFTAACAVEIGILLGAAEVSRGSGGEGAFDRNIATVSALS
jgi:hypothetical protein